MTAPAPAPDIVPGPATLDGVARWLDQLDDDGEPAPRDQLAPVVSAVNVWVGRLPTGKPDADGAYGADVAMGATMLAGRLWRRRDTPGGVETFAGDGAVYVSRTDPDVAMLLRIGAYAEPRIG